MSVILNMRDETFTYTCDECDEPERERPLVVPIEEARNGLPAGWELRRSEYGPYHVCVDCRFRELRPLLDE